MVAKPISLHEMKPWLKPFVGMYRGVESETTVPYDMAS